MKKKMIALLTGALMMISAGSAFASFGDLSLTEVVFDTAANKEYLVNLGTLSSNASGVYSLTPSAASTSFNITTLGVSSSALLAFYGVDNAANASNGIAFVSNGSTTNPAANYSTIPGYQTAMTQIQNNYGAANLTATGTTSGVNSFATQMFTNKDFNGLLDLTNSDNANNAMTLASLANAGNLISIYSIDDQTTGGSGTGVKQFNVSLTSADGVNFTTGVTSSSTAATPIPAAAYLLGSGLMGLLGLRRKARS